MLEPNVTFTESLQACKDGIKKEIALLIRLNAGEEILNAQVEQYRERAERGDLYTIECQSNLDVNSLTKDDLIRLYDYYFRGDKKPGRHIYNRLLASANEKCPFCGGIGRPRNLDHFLPKAHFPQFSILPLNLIPSCRDCNMDGKGQSFAEVAETQILHPYLEASHFFEEQWIFAKYLIGNHDDPNTIQYYVDPPCNWNDTDKARVRQHFNNFDIAKRYATRASSALTEVEAQYAAFRKSDMMNSFQQVILEPVIMNERFKNHWKRVMYLALLNDF